MGGEPNTPDHAREPFPWGALGLVAVVTVGLRAALWALYQPIAYSDTASYRRLAATILDGWQKYDGTRTPGYPLFLAVTGPDENVWLTQMALGVAITLLLFLMAWLLRPSAGFAVVVALAHTLNLGQLFFEANLITETPATFWVMLTLAGVWLWLCRPGVRHPALAAALGFSASLAWLTRPLFIFLPLWILLFIALQVRQGAIKVAWGPAAALLLTSGIILGAWLNFIHSRFNMWSPTVMTGYHLVQHTGNFFEYLPDSEATLRDTYLRYREEQIASHGTQTNTIWRAIPEMQQVSGLNFYRLSRHLARLSWELILAHPGLYLRNVLKGWWLFWRAPLYWTPEALRWTWLQAALGSLAFVERLALVGANLLFVVSSLLALVWGRLRSLWHLSPPLWCLAGAIWGASIVQTLVDHGDNPRFLVPLQSLVVLWVLWIGYQTLAARRTRSQTLSTAPETPVSEARADRS